MVRSPDPALFEDPHTDSRVRRTIPQFARIGAAVAAVSAPLTASTTGDRLVVLGAATVAVLVSIVLTWRRTIERLPQVAIYALLVVYCAVIAVAVAATGEAGTAYRFFYALPVLYTSVVFTGVVRFSMAAVAIGLDHLIAVPAVGGGVEDSVVRATVLCVLGMFGAEVSDILRSTLRSMRALHSVVEASSGDPLAADLAGIGLDAALSVVPWDFGAVILRNDDGSLRIAAHRTLSTAFVDRWHELQRSEHDHSLVAQVLHRPGITYVEDVASAYPDRNHVLRAEGVASLALLPLAYHGAPVGVLALGHRRRTGLPDAERARLHRVAEQLALALGNAAAWRREAEVVEQLRELNQRKDEFLANVSHELRTPAATMRLVATTLTRMGDRLSDEQVQEMLQTLERRADQLCTLVGNLLDQAVADAGGMRLTVADLDWDAALAGWVHAAELATGRAVELVLPPEPVPGSADPVKLERVVANLIANAAKFSEPGTPITVALRSDGDRVAVTVTDRGAGIPPDMQERVFERFYQVDGTSTRTAGGFGIGLSLVRSFVEAHGGVVSLTSDPGTGSTFTVTLPRRQPEAVAPPLPATGRDPTTFRTSPPRATSPG